MSQYQVKNTSGSPMPAGSPLSVVGFDVTAQAWQVALADATAQPALPMHLVAVSGLQAGQIGPAYDNATTEANLNTWDLGVASTSVYLGGPGQYAAAAPAGGLSQVIGTVAVQSLTVGSITVALTPDFMTNVPTPTLREPAVNETGSTIAIDVLVYTQGIDDTTGSTVPTFAGAANTAQATAAQYVTTQGAADEAEVVITRTGLSQPNLNTNAGNVGDPVYLGTAGAWTLTKPTLDGGAMIVQEIGRIVVKSASVGQIRWDIKSPRVAGVTIPLDLEEFRLAAYGNTAAIAGALSTNTAPTIGQVNGSTDPTPRISWAAAAVAQIGCSCIIPDNVDVSQAAKLHIVDGTGGTSDTVAVTAQVFVGEGGTDAGSAFANMHQNGVQDQSISVTLPASSGGKRARVLLTPGTHGTDAVTLDGARLVVAVL